MSGDLGMPGSAGTAADWTKFDKVVVAHAVVGSLAWMILSPSAILLARISAKRFTKAHIVLQSTGTLLLTIAAVALGCVATEYSPASTAHFQTAHHRMGLVLLILLLLQVLLGRIASLQHDMDLRFKPVSTIAHISMGIVLTALGYAQVWLGIQQYEEKSGRPTPLAVKVIWAMLVGGFSIALIVSAVLNTRKAAENDGITIKEKLVRQRRKASVHLGQHGERGLRSDGLWVGMMESNSSAATYLSGYSSYSSTSGWTDNTVIGIAEPAKVKFSDSIEDGDFYPYSVHLTYQGSPVLEAAPAREQPSSRAIPSHSELTLPVTTHSPLGVIAEEAEEYFEEPEDEDQVQVSESRPVSLVVSTDGSSTTDPSQTAEQSRRRRSSKRKAVPKL